MNYNVTVTPTFLQRLKQLAKRYRSIKDDVWKLAIDLQNNPELGSDLGKGLRKVRMSISSKGKGKRGGARVITYTLILTCEEAEIKLLTIYDKSDRESVTDKELRDLMAENGLL